MKKKKKHRKGAKGKITEGVKRAIGKTLQNATFIQKQKVHEVRETRKEAQYEMRCFEIHFLSHATL